MNITLDGSGKLKVRNETIPIYLLQATTLLHSASALSLMYSYWDRLPEEVNLAVPSRGLVTMMRLM